MIMDRTARHGYSYSYSEASLRGRVDVGGASSFPADPLESNNGQERKRWTTQ